MTFICLPRFVTLCKPCQGDSECTSDLAAGTNKCLSYGTSGSFCGAECVAEGDCKDGYDCVEGQCRLREGECGCGWKAVVASTWCAANGVEMFRFNRATPAIDHINSVADPDGVCEYWDHRMLTVLDGDGIAELVHGNGHPKAATPQNWVGNVYARKFTDLGTLATDAYCTDCFNTDVEGLFGGLAMHRVRFNDELRVRVRYLTDNQPDVSNLATDRWWTFDLVGQPLAEQPTTVNTMWNDSTDLGLDGTPDTDGAVARRMYPDVDGHPDRMITSGGSLGIQLWQAANNTWATSEGSAKEIDDAGVSIQELWDIDSDDRLEVLVSTDTGQLNCYERDAGTWSPYTSIPWYFPLSYRTLQRDNWEPNDGQDTHADGLPDSVSTVPSALTTSGEFYSVINSPTDEDYWHLDTRWGGQMCIRLPAGMNYSMAAYSFADRIHNDTGATGGDGLKDGLVWENTSGAQTKCFSGGMLVSTRNGEYHFIVGVKSADGDFSAQVPYWTDAPK